jgi:hypothetical protein
LVRPHRPIGTSAHNLSRFSDGCNGDGIVNIGSLIAAVVDQHRRARVIGQIAEFAGGFGCAKYKVTQSCRDGKSHQAGVGLTLLLG